MHSIFFPLDVENPLSRLSCYSCIWSFKLVISKGCFTPEISYMTTRCHCVSPNVRFQNNVPAFSLVQSLQLLFFSEQEPRQRVSAVKDLIRQLPKPNQDTMQILFRHLKRWGSLHKRGGVVWERGKVGGLHRCGTCVVQDPWPRVTQTQAHSSAMPSAVFGMQES